MSLGIRSLDSSSRRKKSTLGGLGFGLCRSLMQGCSSSPSRSPSIWFPCALGGPLECLSPTRCSIQTGLGASVERQRPCRCLHQTHMQPVPLPRPPSRSRDSSTNASPGRKFVASLPRCHALQGPLQAHVRVNTRQPAWPGNLVRMFEPSIIMAPGNGAHSAPTTALYWPGLTLVPNLGMGNCTHVARVNRLSLPCGACRRRTWLRTDESRPAARLRSHRRRQKLWLH